MSLIEFREELHPRAPRGSQKGGEFVAKGVSSDTKGFKAASQLKHLVEQVRSVLTPDLLKKKYREKANRGTAGHCYAASEAIYHMVGGAEAGWKPMVLSHEDFPDGLEKGESHWFLQDDHGNIVDPTADQFKGLDIPYDAAIGKGFLTKQPSKRAAEIIKRVEEQSPGARIAEPVLSDGPLPSQSIIVPFLRRYAGPEGGPKPSGIEVLVNPTSHDAESMAHDNSDDPHYQYVRALYDKHGNVFTWKGSEATHDEIATGLETISGGNIKIAPITGEGWTPPFDNPDTIKKIERGQANAQEAGGQWRKSDADLSEWKQAEPIKPLMGMAPNSHQKTISPRLITAKKLRNAAAGQYMRIGIAAMKNDPKFVDNVSLMRDANFYPSLKLMTRWRATGDDAAATAEEAKKQLSANLVFMFNNATAEEKKSLDWYRGARKLVDEWSKKYKLDDASIAGVIATLSPTKDWDMNIYLAESVIDIYQNQQGYRWNDAMEKTAKKILHTAANKKILARIGGKKPKKLSELTSSIDKAAWIRVFDETFNDRRYRAFNPDGTMGDYHRNQDGAFSKVSWQSLPNVADAIDALESKGDLTKISGAMKEAHKVRSFYNNILDPDADNEDVTIDTHAVGAALMLPLPGAAVPVWHSLGLSPELKEKPEGWRGASSSIKTGTVGLYGIYADAYRDAAKRLGVRPDELQAVVWNVKRNTLLSDTYNEADFAKVHAMWRDYHDGKSTLEDTQRAVLDFGRKHAEQANARYEANRAKATARAARRAAKAAKP